MKWIDYDARLKRLYNAIAISHSETTSYETSQKKEAEAMDLMRELTELLKNKQVSSIASTNQ